ncbi:hypothetical protein QBC37DRAFT_12340 [Rhypophila decipiens]|uniref:Uncharacterized protein n=1 Tax=Rhypophila decipiens TaxID=261697 RepID=A0AAN7B3J3_9PEZI|nr:hypothetical protein QBC37DRAFT_12340 [Rhypophila decipiens]
MVCADEMKTLAEELDTLAMKDTQRFLGRQWKGVKLVLNEKRLKEMSAAVLGHTTALDLHLAGLGSDMLIETRESLAARIDQQSGSIRNSITQGRASLEQANDRQRTFIQQSITQNGISLQQAIDRQGAYLQHTIVGQKVSIEESVDRQATSFQQTIGQHAIWQQQAIEREGVLIRQTVSKSESRLIEQQAASTLTLRDDLAQVCNEVVQVSKEVTNVRDEAKRPREEFQGENVASTAREYLIMRKLSQLLEKVQLYAPRVDEFDNNPDSEDIVPHGELTESLGWLLGALREKRGIFGRDEAKDAVDALAGFLERMCSYLSTNSAAADASKSRHWGDISAPSDIAGLRENLRSLQGIILCARSVSLNANNIKRKRPVETELATKRSKMTRIDLSVGTVLVTSTRTVCLATAPPTPISPHEPIPVEAPSEQNETRISYFPRLARGSSSKHVGYVHGFHTVLEQCYDYQTGGTFNSIPRLSINRVIPADSPVFSVVLEGDLTEFQRMLWRVHPSIP